MFHGAWTVVTVTPVFQQHQKACAAQAYLVCASLTKSTDAAMILCVQCLRKPAGCLAAVASVPSHSHFPRSQTSKKYLHPQFQWPGAYEPL